MRIVQMSDLHFGEGLFRPELLSAAIEETNAVAPDLMVVGGDLTIEGYRGEFERCRQFLDKLSCSHVVMAMRNRELERFVRYDADPFAAAHSASVASDALGRDDRPAATGRADDHRRARGWTSGGPAP